MTLPLSEPGTTPDFPARPWWRGQGSTIRMENWPAFPHKRRMPSSPRSCPPLASLRGWVSQVYPVACRRGLMVWISSTQTGTRMNPTHPRDRYIDIGVIPLGYRYVYLCVLVGAVNCDVYHLWPEAHHFFPLIKPIYRIHNNPPYININ